MEGESKSLWARYQTRRGDEIKKISRRGKMEHLEQASLEVLLVRGTMGLED